MRSAAEPVALFPVIFAAPSGAGKTSIAQSLRQRRDDVAFSVSATTRPPRPYEEEGVDYYFRSEPEFREMVAAGELLEWAEVHGNLYGTPQSNLTSATSAGKHLILDIDIQGSRLVRQKVPDAVSIFVLPPSGSELSRRLVGRNTEPIDVRLRRLRAARLELAAAAEFDYVIVNDDLDVSVDAVETILRAETQRTTHQPGLAELINRMCEEVDRELVLRSQ